MWHLSKYLCTKKSSWNPNSNTRGYDRSRDYRNATAYVIAQQYSPVTFDSTSFHSLTQKIGACVQQCDFFFPEVLLVLICVKLCKLKLRYSCGADKSLARPGMKQAAPVKSALGRGMDCDLARVRTGGVLLRMWQWISKFHKMRRM